MQALKDIYRELRKDKLTEPFTYMTDADLMHYLSTASVKSSWNMSKLLNARFSSCPRQRQHAFC